MNAVLHFWRCSWQRKMLLLDAALRLLLVRFALAVLPFAGVDKFTRSGLGGPLRRSVVGEITSAIETASLYVPASNCLVRALAASWLLRRNGFDPALRFGAARVGDDLDAHAWVEIEGRVVLGGCSIDRYAKLEPIPQP